MTEYFPRCQFIQDCTEGCHLASQPLEDPIHDEAALNPPAPVDISDAHEKIYTPINPWQTRLLRLLPRQTGQKIHVELHVADLIHDSGAVLHVKQEVVQYSALSYCWGPATPAASVICNEVEIRVTPNLYSALRRLRREEESVWLWADALCINQTDLFERSMQVTKMLLIYYKATAVVVWLGSSGEYTNLACEALRIFEPVLYDDDGWSTSEGSEASVLEEERNLRREGMWAGPQSESLGVARASAPRGLPLSHLGQNHDFPIQTTEQVFDRNRTKSGHRQTNRAAGRGEEPSTGHGSKHVQFGELGSQQSRHRDSDDSESSVSAGSWESDSEEGSIASFSSGDPDVDGVEVPPMILCFEHSRAVKAGLIDLLSRPYFQRLWVMQEVWAASGYLSVLCGPEEIHWSILTRASKLLNRLVSPMEWSTHKDRIGRLFRKFDEPTPLERMELVNGARSPGARSDYSSRVEYADGAGSLNNHDTVRLLNRAVGSQCSDPRDHIYALLGMSTDKSEVLDGAPSGNVAIPISYDRSTSQVFQDVMRYVMHRDGGLWILLTASTFGGEVDRVQLPSWCRDWRTPTSQGNATRWMKRLDRVRMSGPGQFFPNDTPILQVTGFRIAFAPESGATSNQKKSKHADTAWQPDYESAPEVLRKWSRGLRWFLPSLPKAALPGDSAVMVQVSRRVLAPLLLRRLPSTIDADRQTYSYVGPVVPGRDFSDLKDHDHSWPSPSSWPNSHRPKVPIFSRNKATYTRDVDEKDLLDEIVLEWRKGRGGTMATWSIL